MATKNEKYHYINRVGLGRDSWALERFIADCVRHHMDDQPGKLAAVRLTEYYELLDRLNILPGGLAMLSPVVVTMEHQPGNGVSAPVPSAIPVPSAKPRTAERPENAAPSKRRTKNAEGEGDVEAEDSHRAEANRADAEDRQWDDL